MMLTKLKKTKDPIFPSLQFAILAIDALTYCLEAMNCQVYVSYSWYCANLLQTCNQHPTLVPACETYCWWSAMLDFSAGISKLPLAEPLPLFCFVEILQLLVLAAALFCRCILSNVDGATLRTPCWMSDRAQVQKLPQVKRTAVRRNFINLRFAGFVWVLRNTTWHWEAPVNFAP